MNRLTLPLSVFFIASAVLLLGSPARADDSSLVLSMGVERSKNSLSGEQTDKARWSPILGLDYRDGRFFAGTSTGVGYEVLKFQHFTATAALSASAGRKDGTAKDSPRLRGMGKVKASGQLMLGVNAPVLDFIDLSAMTMVSTQSDQGYVANLGASVGFPIWDKLSAFASAGVTRADRKHAQTFYGVTPAQALRSGNAAYAPKAGWIASELSLGLEAELDASWSASGSVGRKQLRGVAALSPLYKDRSDTTASLTVSYKF